MDALEYATENMYRLAWKLERGDYLTVYRHRKYPDMQMIEYSKTDYQMYREHKYWLNKGFLRRRVFDLHEERKKIDPNYRAKRRRVTKGA